MTDKNEHVRENQANDPLLEVRRLHTCFKTGKGIVKAVNDVSFTLEAGRTLGIVGESGSGKSVTAMSILRLLDANGFIEGGEIFLEGRELTALPLRELYRIRGNRASVIFQEPMTSLNPVFSIKRQLCEPFMIHQGMGKREAAVHALNMLRDVQIPNPETVLSRYPHQLSGGMRQRVMIAMALACRPRLLIADEPTTALDVTIQAQILGLMRKLQGETGTAILFITHDLGVINEIADDVAVMYCGQVVEKTSADRLFVHGEMSHPYTEGLIASIPRINFSHRLPRPIAGAVPNPRELPRGCKFSPRCPYCTARCVAEEPPLLRVGETQEIRCFYPKKEERQSDAHQKNIIRYQPE